MKQSQPLRVEDPNYASFGTARSINSALWFVNNTTLENRILGYLGRYKDKYDVTLYAFVFSGSHYHPLAHFPGKNRAYFYRDLNARAAEAVRFLVPQFPGGPLLERRYSEQAVPLTQEDIEEEFFYCALQPVHSGLCERISEYPGYNSFHDAICGIKRTVSFINWADFNAQRCHNHQVKLKDFVVKYELAYNRIPGYEHLSQKEYKELMLSKLEKRRVEIVSALKAQGHRFMTNEELLAVIPGTTARNPKKSKRNSPRPLVLTRCVQARKSFLEKYFSILVAYKKAIVRFFAGELSVEFPPGTYRPPGLLIRSSD